MRTFAKNLKKKQSLKATNKKMRPKMFTNALKMQKETWSL